MPSYVALKPHVLKTPNLAFGNFVKKTGFELMALL